MSQAVNEYQNAIRGFLQILGSFSQEQANAVPAYGGWKPLQVADHVNKGQWGMPDILNGNSRHTNRQPDLKKPQIESLFLDFSTKLTSPDFILPGEGPFDKTTMVNTISNRSADIVDAFSASDAAEECLDFEIPGFGQFTRLEWLYFITCHAKRHTWQLEKMVGNV